MFTSLDFLKVGKKWIPSNSAFAKRQTNFVNGRLLYEGEFEEVFKDVWDKISTRYGLRYSDAQKVMIKVNLFRVLTDTFKLLAFDKPVEIFPEMDIKQYRELVRIMQQSFISGHCQGNGVFKVYSDSANNYKIGSINPELWIPVYYPDNLAEVQYHVVANTYEVENDVAKWYGDTVTTSIKYLNVEVHSKGSYERIVFELDNFNTISEEISREVVRLDKWSDFAVFPFDYGTPNFRDYGVSAYDDLIPIVEELIVRLSNASKILDDHSDPQIVAPDGALEFDAITGERQYKRHQVLALTRKDEPQPQYLTWDGNLDANNAQIDRVMDLFYMMSGTNPQMFGKDIAGNLSCDALAKILLIPLSKIGMMLQNLENAIEGAYNCWLSLNGKTPEANIKFNIGAFNQISDISERVTSEYNAGVISLERAVLELNPYMDDTEQATEVERIKAGVNVNSMDSILGRPEV